MTSVTVASLLVCAPASSCYATASPFAMAATTPAASATSAATFARPASLVSRVSRPTLTRVPASLSSSTAYRALSARSYSHLQQGRFNPTMLNSRAASYHLSARLTRASASSSSPGSAESEEVRASGSPPAAEVASDTDAFSESETIAATNGSATNGVASGNGSGSGAGSDVTAPIELEFVPLEGFRKLGAQLKMLVAWPWRRVKKNSVLYMRLKGNVPEMVGSSFSSTLSLPQICDNLRKAAVDPRVSALLLHVDPLQCGWGKLQEIARHVAHFRKSGKPCIAYMTVGGEQEYFLASACEEIYAPPGAYLSLRGLAVQGQFLGGVLQKAGVQPQIERIGKYKSAGDQLARSDMSEPNREMLTAILDDYYGTWTTAVAENRGVSMEAVQALLHDGVQEVEELKTRGFLTDVIYGIQVEEMLKERLGQDKEKPLQSVEAKKYAKINPSTVGLGGRDRIAVLRAVGAISQGKDRGGGMGSGVKSETIIQKLRMVKENKQFKALVLRIDSPGGDALASDLMWNEIRELAKVKPVVACMSDVAASGGYYMAMAAPHIVAEPLTLTGSIGVVTGKFSLGELYERIGFSKEIISRGRFAELNADQRPFTPDEEEYFARGAKIAYQRFRDKAALSRSMKEDDMEAVAQGRVWTGQAALKANLVDSLGGIWTAVQIANMWNEIRELAKVKPVVACMSDVAASGGYYMAMAAPHIVAEPLTLTGSIGVVTGKFSLGELYERIGFSKEIISRGRFAELNADQRPFTPDEEEYFARGAKIAYQRFRDKAALSRSMKEDDMEAVAQGRVWTGQAALKANLVDSLGGIWTAVQIAKSKAGIDPSRRVRIVELSRSQPSITAFLSGGAQSLLSLSGFLGPEARAEALREVAADLLLSPGLGASFGASLGSSGAGSFGNLLSGGIDASMSSVLVKGSSGTVSSSLLANTAGVHAVMEGDITVRGSGSETAAAIYNGAGGSAALAELAVLLSPTAAVLGGALGQSSQAEGKSIEPCSGKQADSGSVGGR
ncbi:hypothetical protein CLOP_g11128 [Closterium sp. NIES-67]|nr:hypothetical protein CLOP_g11128 [Closterium sp. NIES-67]